MESTLHRLCRELREAEADYFTECAAAAKVEALRKRRETAWMRARAAERELIKEAKRETES